VETIGRLRGGGRLLSKEGRDSLSTRLPRSVALKVSEVVVEGSFSPECRAATNLAAVSGSAMRPFGFLGAETLVGETLGMTRC